MQFSLVAAARSRAARLELVTSRDEHAIADVARDKPTVVNLGPLRVTNGGAMSMALYSIDGRTSGPGPDVAVSVIEGRYLRPGEALQRMTPLAQTGPGRLRGLSVPFGHPAAYALSPGVRCSCVLRVEAGASAARPRCARRWAG